MIVGELRIVPVGEGTSMQEPVTRAVGALEGAGVRFEVGPLGTTLESESLEQILDAVRRAHEAAFQGSERVVTSLTLDERRDKEETAETLEEIEPPPRR